MGGELVVLVSGLLLVVSGVGVLERVSMCS